MRAREESQHNRQPVQGTQLGWCVNRLRCIHTHKHIYTLLRSQTIQIDLSVRDIVQMISHLAVKTPHHSDFHLSNYSSSILLEIFRFRKITKWVYGMERTSAITDELARARANDVEWERVWKPTNAIENFKKLMPLFVWLSISFE